MCTTTQARDFAAAERWTYWRQASVSSRSAKLDVGGLVRYTSILKLSKNCFQTMLEHNVMHG